MVNSISTTSSGECTKTHPHLEGKNLFMELLNYHRSQECIYIYPYLSDDWPWSSPPPKKRKRFS